LQEIPGTNNLKTDDEVVAIADNLMDEFDEAFKELAK